jgi:hypothetical protein
MASEALRKLPRHPGSLLQRHATFQLRRRGERGRREELPGGGSWSCSTLVSCARGVRGRRPASPTPRLLPCTTTSGQRRRLLEASRTQRSPEDWWERPEDLVTGAHGGPVLRCDARRRAGIRGTATSSRS